MLDKRTRLAYFNGLVLPHLDYPDTIWGDQPGLTSEMQQLHAFQNRFAKKITGGKLSSAEALASLKWFPLHGRRFGHRCLTVQNEIKGDVPEHFEIFRTPLSQLHNYNTRNGFLPRHPKPRTEWGRRTTYFRTFNDWATLPLELKSSMPDMIFKTKLTRVLGNSS